MRDETNSTKYPFSYKEVLDDVRRRNLRSGRRHDRCRDESDVEVRVCLMALVLGSSGSQGLTRRAPLAKPEFARTRANAADPGPQPAKSPDDSVLMKIN